MATLMSALGEIRECAPANGVAFTLAELQAIVGGYIEAIGVPDGRVMFMNEDGGRPVTWDIAADDFAIVYPGVAPIWRSTDGWMACEACGGLIAGGDRPALDARALAFVRTQVPPGHPIAPYLAAERELLAQFWRHYRGIRRYPTPYAVPDCDCRNPRCGHKASQHVGPDGACTEDGCPCGPGGWA